MENNNKVHFCDISISQADYEITEDNIIIYNVPITGEIVQYYEEDDFKGNMFKPMEELSKMSIKNTPITFLHPENLLMDYSTSEVAKLTEGILREPSKERKSFFNDKKVYADMIINKGTPQALHIEKNLRDNTPIDVSIGFQCGFVDKKGIYNGKEYDRIQINHEIDHLAVLIGNNGDIYTGRAPTSQGYGIGMDHNNKQMTDSNNKLMDTVTKRNEELVSENTNLKKSLSDAQAKLSDVDSIKKELADAKAQLKDSETIKAELKKYKDAEKEVVGRMKDALKKKYPNMSRMFDEASDEVVKEQYSEMKTEEAEDPKADLTGGEGTNNKKQPLSDMDLFEIQTGKKKIEDFKE